MKRCKRPINVTNTHEIHRGHVVPVRKLVLNVEHVDFGDWLQHKMVIAERKED